MKSNEQIGPKPGTPHPKLGLAQLLAVVALGLSGFLLWGSLAGDSLPGCGVQSGCDTVLHSRWSKWFGIPVSLPALLLYATVLAASAMLTGGAAPSLRRMLWSFLVASSAALIGAAAWFIGLQFFVIKAICPFCMTAHACGLVVGALMLARAPWGEPDTTRAKAAPPATGIRHGGMLVTAGLMAVAIMALGQVLYQPPTFDVQALNAEAPRVSAAPSNAPGTLPSSAANPGSKTNRTNTVAEAARPKAPRILGLHGDLFQLNLGEVPLMGSPDAPFVIVHFFDYSCRHCRVLHPILLQAVRDLSNQLAIVTLPVPLATNCNRIVKMPIPDHVNACAYALDGLTLFRANPAKWAEFEDWIFAPARPPAPAVTRAEAIRLAGTNEFAKALADPWVTNRLEMDIRIFETNYARYKRSALPQLMIGTNIVTGNFRTADEFYKLLAAQFAITLPPKSTNTLIGTNAPTAGKGN